MKKVNWNTLINEPQYVDIGNEAGKELRISWDDIILSTKCYSEYDKVAISLVKLYLGYDPGIILSYPSYPMLQTLIGHFKGGIISENDFAQGAENIARDIRNSFMKQYRWLFKSEYDEEDFKIYNTYLIHVKNEARKRLFDGLLNPTDIQISLYPELIVRGEINRDTYKPGMPSTKKEMVATSMVWYREAYLRNKSIEEADQSRLLGSYLGEIGNIPPHSILL